MDYESYESDGQYGPYEGGGADYPREGYPEQGHPDQGYPDQGYAGYPGPGYSGQYPEQYQEPYQDPGRPEPGRPQQPQYQDAQWAQSGLGWEQQAWDEARLGVSPLQEQGYYGQQPYGQPYDEQYEQSPQYAQPYGQPYDEQSYERYEQPLEQPYDQPYEQYGQPYEPPEREREREPETGPREEHAPGFPRQRAADDAARVPDAGSQPSAGSKAAPATSSETAASSPAAPTQGRGAFGAAGIGVVTAVAALASTGAMLVVVVLVQAGVAYGWQQATTLRGNRRADKRTVVLSALIGWAATAAAFRLSVNDDSIGLPATLGVSFLLLAADQTLRSGTFGAGERMAGLGIAVTGGLFAVLPACFVAADRTDSGLTAACAVAAAVGVLCCALLGRNPIRGIVAALVVGLGVGAVAAQSLQAQGGLEAGALGGAVAALGAAAAVGATDRVAAEGDARGSIRIVTQVLPVALAAMGALFATAVYR